MPRNPKHVSRYPIQDRWEPFLLMMKARGWPENVIAVCRQAFFSGAAGARAVLMDHSTNSELAWSHYQNMVKELEAFEMAMKLMDSARVERKKENPS